MAKNSKLVAALLSVMSLLACGAKPVQTDSTNNPEVTVDLLATHDNCNIYRFSDAGNIHYYTVCKEAKTQTMTDYCVSTGKSCMPHHDNIDTEEK